MNNIVKKPIEELGYGFIADHFLPTGKDEYYLRDRNGYSDANYRQLATAEIEVLIHNNNTADNWQNILVSQKFRPELVKRCNFYGKVRIGELQPYLLEYHHIQLQVGLYDSTIVSCDLGDNVVVKNVTHMAHYQIGSESILYDIAELVTTSCAKFGNGVVKDGEVENGRIWVEVCNENKGRRILPFDGMLPGDAYIWSKYREDRKLMDKFVALTEREFQSKRGEYGSVGERTIIKNCKVIKNVKVGDDAYIKGANKLKNLTIRSSDLASTQIGEGVELVNGIVGFGCRVFYGVKAVRFIMGSHSSLKYGARLINSYLGNNATISCCEVLNSLIFPGHEQHHNNSFLCASLVKGQSNIAAGVTIGSNHNSRGADGEIVAGRGFWPGLCVSLKHNSKFASYTLIAKGDYPAEIDLPLPFCLLSQDLANDELIIMPNYWFKYNMYALARNSWKYNQRDQRHLKIQKLDFDYLAPDTIQEIFNALEVLKLWVGKSQSSEEGLSREQYIKQGENILENNPQQIANDSVYAFDVENTKRKVKVLKVSQGYEWYKNLIVLYFIDNLIGYVKENGILNFSDLQDVLKVQKQEDWENVGGQFIRSSKLHELKEAVKSNEIKSWSAVHEFYMREGGEYVADKLNHSFTSVLGLKGLSEKEFTKEVLTKCLDKAVQIRRTMNKGVLESRSKDYVNKYRKMVYDSVEEMNAVVGKLEEDDFIAFSNKEVMIYEKNVESLKATL